MRIPCAVLDGLFILSLALNALSGIALGGLLTSRWLRRADRRLRSLLSFSYPSFTYERTATGYVRLSPFRAPRFRAHPDAFRFPFGTGKANGVAFLSMYLAAWIVWSLILPRFGSRHGTPIRFAVASLLAAQYLGMTLWIITFLTLRALQDETPSQDERLKFGKVYFAKRTPVSFRKIVETCVSSFIALPFLMLRFAFTDKLFPAYLFGVNCILYWLTQVPFIPLKVLRRIQLRFRTPRFYVLILSYAVFLLGLILSAVLYFASRHCV